MKKILLGFVLGVGFVSFLLFGFSHQASYCTQGGNQSSQEQPADNHADAASKSSEDGHAEPSGHAKKPARFGCGIEGIGPAFVHMMDSHEGFFMGFFTLLLVMVTAWLVHTTSGLRESTDKLWEAGERQISVGRESADAAREAANAAKKSAEVAAQTLIHGQRALIVVPHTFTVQVVRADQSLEGYSFQTRFKNVGPTTAKNVSVATKLERIDGPVPTKLDLTLPPEGGVKVDIGPTGEFQSEPQAATIELIDAVQKGTKSLLYYAFVSYNDVFEGTELHHLQFVLSISVVRDPRVAYPGGRDEGPFRFAGLYSSSN